MGGDDAPAMVIAGLEIAAERHPGARFLLVGDEARLAPLLAAHRRAAAVCTFRHAPEVISNEAKPTAALRRAAPRCASRSTRWQRGGVGRGLRRQHRRTAGAGQDRHQELPGIDRPAMAAIGPSARGDVVMLDLGANVTCDTRNLVEFAVMGDVFARTVLGLTAPSIGLLNVGSEELKGDDRLRDAAEILRAEPYRHAVPRLCRGPRHCGRHHRRGRDRWFHRQRGA